MQEIRFGDGRQIEILWRKEVAETLYKEDRIERNNRLQE